MREHWLEFVAALKSIFSWRLSPGRAREVTFSTLPVIVSVIIMTFLTNANYAAYGLLGSLSVLSGWQALKVRRYWLYFLVAAGVMVGQLLGFGISHMPLVFAPLLVVWTYLVIFTWHALDIGAPGPLNTLFVVPFNAFMIDHGYSTRMLMEANLSSIVVGAGVLFLFWSLAWLGGCKFIGFTAHQQNVRIVAIKRQFEVALAPGSDARFTALRVTVGTIFAILLGYVIFPLDKPYWIILSVLSVIHLNKPQGEFMYRAVHRSLGTVIGALLYWWIMNQDWPMVAVLVVQCLGIWSLEYFGPHNYTLSTIGLTVFVLIMTPIPDMSQMNPLIVSRVVDTFVGVGLAILAAWLVYWRELHHK